MSKTSISPVALKNVLDTFSEKDTKYAKSVFISSATDLNTLVTDNTQYKKKWRGDNCTILTNAPANANLNIPWELEAGVLGSNINYQYQEFRLYQGSNGSGSKIFRRQKYYYGVNDFRWNNWVSIDEKIGAAVMYSNTVNATTFSFNIPSQDRFRFGIVVYQTGSNSNLAYLGLLFLGADNTPYLTQIYKGSNSVNISAAYSNGTLTFTAGATLYGGIRLIYLD